MLACYRKACKLGARSKNVMKHQYRNFLYRPWRRPKGLVCTPCDHYMRAAGASAADRLKIKEAVGGGPEHEEYMDGVRKWVEKFNGSQGGYVLKEEIGKGHSIFKENITCTRWEVVTVFFLPREQFEADVKRKATKGEVTVQEGARGRMRNSSP